MRAIFSRSRPAIHPVTIGLLSASMMLAPASISAQEDRSPKSPTGLMSLEELGRDIRPRIRKLAEAVFAEQKAQRDFMEGRIGPRIKGGGEEAVYRQAKLTREITELASKEYVEVAAPLERAKLEAEIRLAEAAIHSAEEDLHGIEAIAQRAKQVEPTSILELMSVQGVEASLTSAQLSLQKEKLGLEQAQGKLMIFDQFSKPKRTAELRSEVEKAHSDELAKEQYVKWRNDRIESRKKAIEFFKNQPESIWAPVVKAVDELIGLEAELHARLKEGSPADPKDRASWEEKFGALSSRLRAALGKTEQLRDDIDFGRLGRSIHKAAPPARSGSLFERKRMIAPEDRKALVSATPDWIGLLLASAMIAPLDGKPPFVPISVEELNRKVRPRIRKLAEAVLKAQRPELGDLADDLINRGIAQQGKEAEYQQSKLAREVAEIMVKEYTEGVELQERATIDGEIRLAENSVANMKETVDKIEAVVQKMKKFEPTQIYEMTTVYNLQQSLRAAQLQIPKCQLELEQAQGRLKRHNEFQKSRRIKELLSDVEKARGVESTAKENLDSFVEDVVLLKQRVELARKRKKPDWALVLSALDDAVGLENALQTQLKESPPAEPKERATWDEKLNTQTAKLRAALDRAEQLSDDVEFEQLAERVRELVRVTEAAGMPKSEK